MVSQDYLRFEVGEDEGGLFVAVTHRTTGRRLIGRPDSTHGVTKTKSRLAREMVVEFYCPDDYLFEIGRCGADGRFGTFYRVVHQPTGRSLGMSSLTAPDTRNAHARLLDSLVEELWHEGFLPGTTRRNESGPNSGPTDL